MAREGQWWMVVVVAVYGLESFEGRLVLWVGMEDTARTQAGHKQDTCRTWGLWPK